MTRRSLPMVAVAVSLLAAAAPASAPASALQAGSAASCARLTPTELRFDRGAGQTHGTLRWTVRSSARRTVYRVWRGRSVVGQTKARRMRVNVRINQAYTLRVSPVSGGRALSCSAKRRVRVAYRTASVPRYLAVVAGGAAKLTWNPSRRGDARIAGYRVLRDGSVVRQTRRTSLSAPMGGKSSYTFAVAAVDVKGRVSRPSRAVTVKRGHKPPSTPTDFAVKGTTESTVSLTWLPSRAEGASIKAYRVARDNATIGQFPSTGATVKGLRIKTEYALSLKAVDTLGYVSLPTPTLQVRTGVHRAPATPVGLTASATSDSQVALAWQPGAAYNGRVVGYRVTRNGASVGQHPGPTLQLSNLAAATTYKLSVQTADNHGLLSEPAQVDVRTQDAVPTTGHAVAFLLASTDQSFEDFRARYRQIGTVSPTYFDCDVQTGALTGKDDPLITSWARSRKVVVLPRFNCQRGAILTRILNEPQLRQEWLDGMVKRVADHGYDGVTLDFEAGYATDRGAYTAFTAELAARLHAQGKKLMMAVSAKYGDVLNHPRSSFFDYIELSRHVDTMFVMAWGIHWATSAPGAQDDVSWVNRVVDYVATMPDPSRFVLGMQLYGMDWPNGGGTAHPAESFEYSDLQGMLAGRGATTVLDPTQDALHAAYTDASGVPHDAWYTDAATQGRRIDLARAKGLGGVGFWRLGKEDPRLWQHPKLQPGAGW